MSDRQTRSIVTVLVSGGLDSAILAIVLLDDFEQVQPVYIRFGLRWESAEIEGLRAFLKRTARPGLLPLIVLDEPLAGVYLDHWSLAGINVPGEDSPDEAVYLPGRNLMLLTKAAVFSHVRHISNLAIGVLASNPFPDATPRFFEAMTASLHQGLGRGFQILRPFERLEKIDVLRLGSSLPLGLTVSCLRPDANRHCGSCNKCGERRKAFEAAGIDDPTHYATDDRHHGFEGMSLRCTE